MAALMKTSKKLTKALDTKKKLTAAAALSSSSSNAASSQSSSSGPKPAPAGENKPTVSWRLKLDGQDMMVAFRRGDKSITCNDQPVKAQTDSSGRVFNFMLGSHKAQLSVSGTDTFNLANLLSMYKLTVDDKVVPVHSM